jgi:hypothetical protein
MLKIVVKCDAWSMTDNDKVTLNKWERKFARKVYRPVTEQRVWKIRTKEEVRALP